MKKMISFVLCFIMACAMCGTASAAKGDVVGQVYSTDIRAYINGVPVKSYNIGGKTAVVIEELLESHKESSYSYDDSTRTLRFSTLRPEFLTEDKTESVDKPGKVLGKVYETDIKTLVYDLEVPSFNIGGYTAIAIEDLGYDGAFSPYGGKFVWDEEARTISLEFMYENSFLVFSGDKKVYITVDDELTEAEINFEEVLHCGGGNQYITFPENMEEKSVGPMMFPIKAKGETVGYYFKTPSDVVGRMTYYYPEKVKEAEKTFIPAANKTKETVISHFIGTHSVGEPRARFDTEGYSFVYISVAGTSWTSYNLLQVYADGSYVDYKDEIHMQNRSPQDLVIDEENEKVTFRHTDRYHSEWFTDYEIDLKTGTVSAVEG